MKNRTLYKRVYNTNEYTLLNMYKRGKGTERKKRIGGLIDMYNFCVMLRIGVYFHFYCYFYEGLLVVYFMYEHTQSMK